jgi:hypothetical protein
MALCRATDATPDRVTVQSGRVTPVRRKTETRRQQRIALFRKADRPTVLATQRRRPGQSHLGKADSSGSWTRVEAFPISASALRLPVLFGLERAALALGHHANLDTSYGLFPALVLVGGFWTGCSAHSGASSANRRTTRTVPVQHRQAVSIRDETARGRVPILGAVSA